MLIEVYNFVLPVPWRPGGIGEGGGAHWSAPGWLDDQLKKVARTGLYYCVNIAMFVDSYRATKQESKKFKLALWRLIAPGCIHENRREKQ